MTHDESGDKVRELERQLAHAQRERVISGKRAIRTWWPNCRRHSPNSSNNSPN